MFRNSNTGAVWIATVGLLATCGIRTAAGDDVAIAQQPQPAVTQTSNASGTSPVRRVSFRDRNCRNPWIFHEYSDDCYCITCRSNRTWLSRNNECLFHWYYPSRLMRRTYSNPWIVHESSYDCYCITCLCHQSWLSRELSGLFQSTEPNADSPFPVPNH